MDTTVRHLVALCDAYAAHRRISHWRVSALARRPNPDKPGDGRFFDRLRNGAGCTTATAESVMAWFSDHWPDDLPWPAGIQRPPKSEEAA